jgi:hypothetical protein
MAARESSVHNYKADECGGMIRRIELFYFAEYHVLYGGTWG